MEATEVLDLIDKADTRQFERDIQKLERLVDVGDRIVAQQAVLAAAKEEGSDPTMPKA
jgi:hypothetical protein